MKKLVILLGAFALIGCGEKNESDAGTVEAADSSVDSQAAGNQTEESPADTAKHPPVEPPVAESSSEEPSSDTPTSLSDADVERLLKEAVDADSLQIRNHLFYQGNKSRPYSGWGKTTYDSGQVNTLGQIKNGKSHGPYLEWHENGQKKMEGIAKDGVADLDLASMKYWNSKGEEVNSWEEAQK